MTILRSGMRTMAEVGRSLAQRGPIRSFVDDEEAARPSRAFTLTPLDSFRFDHLTTEEQRARLRYALDRARLWEQARSQQPGLGFLLAGPVGTGKTTIAMNLARDFRRRMAVALPAWEWAGDAPELDDALEAGWVSAARVLDATEAMRLVGDETPLTQVFERDEVIVVDDVGTEEMRFVSADNFVVTRQKRYGRLVDFCYGRPPKIRPRHLILTTMLPLLTAGQQINPELAAVLGDKAFSRIFQMCRGFMCDLTGLPDYRLQMAQELAAQLPQFGGA